jgi:hypothetical protein
MIGWRKREDDALRAMYCEQHYDPKRIAYELDRSVGAIRSRLKFLQIKPSSIKRRGQRIATLSEIAP